MRRRFWLGLLGVLAPLGIAAQETRGNVSGTVRDAQGVVPGAMVAVTNVDTQVSQSQVTNVALNQMRFFTFGARMTF
jgi:hypothetical protein